MARPRTRPSLALARTASVRRHVRVAACTRPAFHYAVLCVWPVSICA